MKTKLFLAAILFPIVLFAQNPDPGHTPSQEVFNAVFQKTNQVLRTQESGGAVGGYGSTLLTTTDAIAGHYFAIQVLQDATIDSLVDTGRDGNSITGLYLPAGVVIYGKDMTRIRLQGGIILAYKKQ